MRLRKTLEHVLFIDLALPIFIHSITKSQMLRGSKYSETRSSKKGIDRPLNLKHRKLEIVFAAV
jgi:hypothetical protein